MDWLRCALVLAVALSGGCKNESGGDTDTDTDGAASFSNTEGGDSFDPPDTFPDTFPDDPTEDPSSPTFTDSDPTEDPSTPTFTDSDPTATATATDTDATDTDTDATDTDATDTAATDTAATDTMDPTGDPPDAGMCCEPQQNAPGCDDDAVTSCVCAQDPFCCDDQWDEICVVAVVIHGCGTCEGVGGDGDCCAANDTPGCDDDEIEACVCAADSQCCLEAWDDTCALGVEFEQCGTCPG